MTLRELNRTLLLRQMLLQRKRISVHDAVARLVALQAQYAPSPYVALWSRVAGFRKEQLTEAFRDGSIVKAGTLRTTLHVSTRDDYPAVAAAYIETQRAAPSGSASMRSVRPCRRAVEVPSCSSSGTCSRNGRRWAVSFAPARSRSSRRAFGPWPHTKPPPYLTGASRCRTRGRRRAGRAGYLAGYGPATREDIQQFTGLRLGQIDAALGGRSTATGSTTCRARRARPRTRPPPFGSCRRSTRSSCAPRPEQNRPARVLDVVFNKKNATTKNTSRSTLRRGCVANREEPHRGRAVRAAARARPSRGRFGGRAVACLVSELKRPARSTPSAWTRLGGKP